MTDHTNHLTTPNAASHPTPYTELNDVLADLVTRTREILGDDLVGAYLQGSFAVGDADLDSDCDCDFLIPVRRAITPEQERALRVLHAEIPTREGHWAHHLEGSYPVLSELGSVTGLGAEWLYIDHGWHEMQWSTHCNTEVARWSLREHGIVLLGPAPRDLLEPVPPEALRAAMRDQIPVALADISTWISLDVAWGQRYAVTTLCRMLYTLRTAEVASKRRSLEWASATMDPGWRELLFQVRDDRPRGFDPDDRATPGRIAETRAFETYVVELALTAAGS